jgi:hypothetical protein
VFRVLGYTDRDAGKSLSIPNDFSNSHLVLAAAPKNYSIAHGHNARLA